MSSSASTTAKGGSGGSADGGAEAAPKKSKMKLVIIAVLVLALGGGGGFFFLHKGKGGDAEAKKKEKKVEKGAVLPVDPISINLADGHYLKLGFALQLPKKVKEQPDPSHALAIAIDQFSGQPMAELSTPKGRRKAIAELKKSVEEAYEDEVIDVYPTTMVMQ